MQYYANRADMPGGSTLGNISNTQVSLNAVDIGLAQLAMHSPFETAGAADTVSLVKALTAFFEHSLVAERDGGLPLSLRLIASRGREAHLPSPNFFVYIHPLGV